MEIKKEDILKEVIRMEQQGQPGALVTLIDSQGATPRHDVARMIVYENKQTLGTIGGGVLEATATKKAIESIEKKEVIRWSENLSQLGMQCGGNVFVLIEPIGVKPLLIIFGAGHVGQEVANYARNLDFYIAVVDDRAEYANKENFPMAKLIVNSFNPEDWTELTFNKNSYCVIVTRGHSHDKAVLRELINYDVQYLGMIGSKVKVNKVKQDLVNEEGISQDKIDRVYSPIGLEIGSETPAEIAISILAQVIKIRRKGH